MPMTEPMAARGLWSLRSTTDERMILMHGVLRVEVQSAAGALLSDRIAASEKDACLIALQRAEKAYPDERWFVRHVF